MKDESAAWLASAEHDLAAARLLGSNGFYAQGVFYTHLAVEKSLKALAIERLSIAAPPLTHDLVYLARACAGDLPERLLLHLVKLSPESTRARYTFASNDEVYTAEVAGVLLDSAVEVMDWLRQQLT